MTGADWPDHKPTCRTADLMVEVGILTGNLSVLTPKHDMFGALVGMAESKGKAPMKGDNQTPEKGKEMVLKLQKTPSDLMDILVYNKNRSLECRIPPSDPNYKVVGREIAKHGFLGQKVYVHGSLTAAGKLRLDVGNILGIQEW